MSEPHKQKIIVYGHRLCPGVPPALVMLRQAHAPYEYINIYADFDARRRVQAINNGYESVPTLLFPDGSSLTEPSAGALKRKLESLGYRVPLTAWLVGNLQWIILGAVMLYAALDFVGVI